MTILVTGSAGFIGFHLARRLLESGEAVVGLDNLNAYYDPTLKAARLAILEGHAGYRHARLDLADRDGVAALFAEVKPGAVVNLAAQAGVRYSLENPEAYVDSNVVGFLNILEGCRATQPKHLVYASTSSVYGANGKLPFNVHDGASHPITLYAATKLANEGMAHAYSHLFGIPSTGFRFFTVYGPWGRPDMALFIFTKKILAGEPIDVFSAGRHARDFTYIDDIVEGVVRTLDQVAAPDPSWSSDNPSPASSSAPYRLYNIGNNAPVELEYFISLIEKETGRVAKRNLLPAQPGDVPKTYADVDALTAAVGFKPSTSIEDGIHRFVKWYREFYKV